MHFQVQQVLGTLQNTLGQAEPQAQVFQVRRGGHHNHVGDAVVHQGDRHLGDDGIAIHQHLALSPGAADNIVGGALQLGAASASNCCWRRSNRRCRACQAEGSVTRVTCTAVTLYSGQLVAQSELSVVITLAPDSG